MDADAIVVGAGLAGLAAAAELADAGQAGHRPRAGAGGEPRRAGVLVARRPLHGRHAGAAAHGDPRLARARLAGLARKRRLRPRRGPLAASLGRGVRGLRRRREARVASGDGASHLPGRRLGRAGRRQRDRPRQLGAALPPHLGNRPRRAGAVRAPGARRSRPRPRDAPLPPPGRRPRRLGRRLAGVHGALLEPSTVARGEESSRVEVGEFSLSASAVIVTSGGIGGDHDLVRASWPERLGTPPARMVAGVPAHVDGRMLAISEAAGANVVNRDRMWHYVEGLHNWSPVWHEPRHPHPARPVVALARRARTAPAGAAVPRASTRSGRSSTSCARATTTPGSCSRSGSSRRSSRSPAPSRTPTSRARAYARSWAARAEARRPGGGVQAERRRLRRGRHAARAGPAG